MTVPWGESGLPFQRVVVVGFGWLGRVLARTLRAHSPSMEIRASTEGGREVGDAGGGGVVDELASSGKEILSGADLVVYTIPLHPTLRLLGEHAEHWDPDTVITDTAGLKAPVLQRMEELGAGHRYVGGHPVVDSEGPGSDPPDDRGLQGVRVWMVHGGAPKTHRDNVQAFWEGMGAVPRWTEAGDHDRSVIWGSHLPQILAHALAGALDSQGFTPDHLGPLGRELTRPAESPSAPWKDLFGASGPALAPAVTSVSRALEVVAGLLQKRDLHTLGEFMESTRRWRQDDGAPEALLGGLGVPSPDEDAESGG